MQSQGHSRIGRHGSHAHTQCISQACPSTVHLMYFKPHAADLRRKVEGGMGGRVKDMLEGSTR